MLQAQSWTPSVTTPYIVALAAEFHQKTWFAVEGAARIASPQRGTRPGNPWGEIISNYLMVEVVMEIASELELHVVGDVH